MKFVGIFGWKLVAKYQEIQLRGKIFSSRKHHCLVIIWQAAAVHDYTMQFLCRTCHFAFLWPLQLVTVFNIPVLQCFLLVSI